MKPGATPPEALGDDERMAALAAPFDAEAFVEISPADQAANPDSQALAIADDRAPAGCV